MGRPLERLGVAAAGIVVVVTALPMTSLAPPPSAAVAAGPASTLYYQAEPDSPAGRGGTFFTTSAESTFEGTSIHAPDRSVFIGIVTPGGQPLVAGTTYDQGSVSISDRYPVVGTCSRTEAAFAVHDVAYRGDGSLAMLSLSIRWTCLDFSTGQPEGSFFAELRFNTSSPTYGGIVHVPQPKMTSLAFGESGSVGVGNAAIGSHEDTPLQITAVGTRPTTVGRVRVAGPNPEDFGIANDGCSNRTLSVGETCTLDMRLRPTALGQRLGLVTIPLDTPPGRREFRIHGRGRIATRTTLSVPPGPHVGEFTVTAHVTSSPGGDPVSGGVDLRLAGSGDTVAHDGTWPDGHADIAVRLDPGTWDVYAAFVGSMDYAPSRSGSTKVLALERMDDWATMAAGPIRFYPYPDGYLDEVPVSGERKYKLSVDIAVSSVATGRVVARKSLPAAVGEYHWGWDGTADGDTRLLPAGEYDVAATLSDGGANEQTFVRRRVLDRSWVEWTNRSLTQSGDEYVLYGKSENATISKSASSYPNGVRIASGRGAAVVGYALPVARSKVYGRLTFQVLGRSTNDHQAVISVWNHRLGSYRDLNDYDAARAIGPSYRWWRTTTDGMDHVSDGTAVAAVMVWRGLGGSGAATFDIERVRLRYQIGTLHPARTAPSVDGLPSVVVEVNEPGGRPIEGYPAAPRLPSLGTTPPPALEPSGSLEDPGFDSPSKVRPRPAAPSPTAVLPRPTSEPLPGEKPGSSEGR